MLRVPLDPGDRGRPVDRGLDDAIGSVGGGHQPVTETVDGLVVAAQHVLGDVDRRGERVTGQRDVIRDEGVVAVDPVCVSGLEVRHEGAAQRDVQHLQTSADAQQRGAGRQAPAHGLDVGAIRRGLVVPGSGVVRHAAVEGGVDVLAAHHHDRVGTHHHSESHVRLDLG